jgi:hypothetical protein
MAFKKPVRTSIRPRVLITGDAKVGKTRACLTFPGQKLVIDPEARVEVYEDRFTDFLFDATKDVRQIREDIRAVREGRIPCDALIFDGASVFYDVLQGAAMSASGEIGIQQWGQLKRVLSSVFDEMYYKLPCAVVVTSRVKPRVLATKRGEAPKAVGTSELLESGDVIDLDRKAAYLFDLMFRIRFDVERNYRDVICLGSVYDEIPVGKTFPLPNGASFYDTCIKALVDARQANPARATDAPTEAEAAAGNRALFVPPPTIADLRALAETAGIAWSLAWVESQDIVRLDPDAKPPVVAYNDRKPKRMYDEELIRAKGILEAIIAEAKALSDRHSDVQDERAGAFDDDEPADAPRSRTGPPTELDGAPPVTERTRKALFAMLNERGITEREDRLHFAAENGVEVSSYSDLRESQALYLCKRAELLKKVVK